MSDLERVLWRDLWLANVEHDVDHEHRLYDELVRIVPEQREADCD